MITFSSPCTNNHSLNAIFTNNFCDLFAPQSSATFYYCDLREPNPEPRVAKEVEVKAINQEDYETSQVTSFPSALSPYFVICHK